MFLHTRHFYTQTLLHTGAFTYRQFYTQTLLHTVAFTHKVFTHRRFYRQKLLHTDPFTHRRFYTDAFTHRRFYTQTLLHTYAFTHRRFYTQTLLHRGAFTSQRLLHADAFTHRSFDTQHTEALYTQKNRNFTSVLGDRPSFRAKELQREPGNRNFTSVFGDRPSFRAKELQREPGNRNFTLVFGDRTSFRAKGLRGTTWTRIFTSVFDDRTSFRAKGLRGTTWTRTFTSVFDDRTSFRAKGLRFVPSRWHCRCPHLQKRNRKEGEGKRARGEDVKIWGCEDVKMWGWEDVKMRRCEDVKMWRWAAVKMRRCEDEKMWRWEDVKMRRCEDEKMWRWEDVKMRRCEDEKMWRWEGVKMRRCEDEKMWRWEDEIQTPTIGRTLRSDALGNYSSRRGKQGIKAEISPCRVVVSGNWFSEINTRGGLHPSSTMSEAALSTVGFEKLLGRTRRLTPEQQTRRRTERQERIQQRLHAYTTRRNLHLSLSIALWHWPGKYFDCQVASLSSRSFPQWLVLLYFILVCADCANIIKNRALHRCFITLLGQISRATNGIMYIALERNSSTFKYSFYSDKMAL